MASKSKGNFWKTVGTVALGVIIAFGAGIGIYELVKAITPDEQIEQIDKGNNTVVTPQSGLGMSLKAVRATSDELSGQTNEAYTISATITPANATNQKVDWSVAFANPASSWAQGKKVTDYVTITPTSDGALTATLTCLKAFGEQIIISCTSRSQTMQKATCTVDYVKRATDAGFEAFWHSFTESVTGYDDFDNLDIRVMPTFGDGTLSGVIKLASLSTELNKSANFYASLSNTFEDTLAEYGISGTLATQAYNFDVTEDEPSEEYECYELGPSMSEDNYIEFSKTPTSQERTLARQIFQSCLRTAIESNQSETHAYLNVSYNIVYNGQIYQTVTDSVSINFNYDTLYVLTTGINLSHSSIIF